MGGGMGGGMGRGMGMGGGMGRGMGMGGGMGAEIVPPVTSSPRSPAPEQELDALNTQSQVLAQQLSAIQRRIEELKKKS